jgi:predicted permease
VRLPVVYAILAAIAVYFLQVELPRPLLSAIDIAGAGAVPVMLILLGMQLADTKQIKSVRVTLAASGVRLLIGPLVGALIATIIGLQGVSRASSILEASLPAAVAPIILTTEFNLQPETMTSIVAFSTVLSPLSLVTAIWLFGL